MTQSDSSSPSSGEGSSPAPSSEPRLGPVGVLVIGHGSTATHLLAAACTIAGAEALAGVVAIDAGAGADEAFEARVDAALEQLDAGRGVLVLADLMGSSPCNCGRKDLAAHRGGVLVTGLNLAMLCKLATSDRDTGDAIALAEGLAASARRAVRVSREAPPPSAPPDSKSPGPEAGPTVSESRSA